MRTSCTAIAGIVVPDSALARIGLLEGRRSEHDRFDVDGANEAKVPGYVRPDGCDRIRAAPIAT